LNPLWPSTVLFQYPDRPVDDRNEFKKKYRKYGKSNATAPIKENTKWLSVSHENYIGYRILTKGQVGLKGTILPVTY
jgi:hypothetical protein